VTYWKDKQTFLISEHHGKFKGWTQDFWLIFQRAPNLSQNMAVLDPVHISLSLPNPQTSHPSGGHGISASGITIETSRLPGLGRKTPWLSYQQIGDAYTKQKMSQLLEVFKGGWNLSSNAWVWMLFLTSLEPTFANDDSASSTSCFLPTSPRQNLFAQVSPKPEFRLVSGKPFLVGGFNPFETY